MKLSDWHIPDYLDTSATGRFSLWTWGRASFIQDNATGLTLDAGTCWVSQQDDISLAIEHSATLMSAADILSGEHMTATGWLSPEALATLMAENSRRIA